MVSFIRVFRLRYCNAPMPSRLAVNEFNEFVFRLSTACGAVSSVRVSLGNGRLLENVKRKTTEKTENSRLRKSCSVEIPEKHSQHFAGPHTFQEVQ